MSPTSRRPARLIPPVFIRFCTPHATAVSSTIGEAILDTRYASAVAHESLSMCLTPTSATPSCDLPTANRAHAAWPADATAEAPEGSAQRRQRPISGGGGGGRSMLGDVGAERAFPRPDRVGALDQRGGGGPSLEGPSPVLPRLLASTVGEEVGTPGYNCIPTFFLVYVYLWCRVTVVTAPNHPDFSPAPLASVCTCVGV